MATTAADGAVFLDTNVLIHANVLESPLHDAALAAVETRYDTGVELWVSRQVLSEYLAVRSRPQLFAVAQPMPELLERVRHFADRFRIAEDSADVTARLWTLPERIAVGGKQIHDANIVATMQAYGIGSLLTDNIDDFERFEGVITVLPLPPSAS